MALRKDHRGMAVIVDAMIFLVALTMLSAFVLSAPSHEEQDDRLELLRSYHTVMLSGELPGEDGSSMSAATLNDYLLLLSIGGPPSEQQVALIGSLVNGTLAELENAGGASWLVIELGTAELLFGSEPRQGGEVFADRRELGDGSVISTLFLA